MRQVRIRYLAGPKSPMRFFKEWVNGGATWTFNRLRGSLYNESDAFAEIMTLKEVGFSSVEIDD